MMHLILMGIYTYVFINVAKALTKILNPLTLYEFVVVADVAVVVVVVVVAAVLVIPIPIL